MSDKNNKFSQLEKYIFAHRGFHDKPLIPENSMPAFRRAGERGFGAELDIHLMKDGRLAVIHDACLRRTAHADVFIEDLCAEDLPQYHLEESSETIPLLEDVLELGLPLIVELKCERGNAAALSEAAWNALKDYPAPWCMESFDPRAVFWFAKHHPEVCRGQLSENFFRNPEVELPGYQKWILTRLLGNIFCRPDFVAYQFEDRDNPYLRRYLQNGGREASWTIRKREDLEAALRAGSIPIFECFDPSGKEEKA